MDLKEFFTELKSKPAEYDRITRLAVEWRGRALRYYPKPTIAMINGYCFGGAYSIVEGCDLANMGAIDNGLPTPARHGQNERVTVLNRKNALFAGHDQGAENWACIASLIETCKLHGVDPQTYFTEVLSKLVNLWPASRLDELMPWTRAVEQSTTRLAA